MTSTSIQARRSRTRPRQWSCESLEGRLLLSGTGASTDLSTSTSGGTGSGYVLEGTQWSSPTISYSFVPDGTSWDQGTSNLQSTLNSSMGSGTWERQIALALQTWASVSNLNFTQVGDSGAPFNTQGPSQGAPDFGDIRIAGYGFANSSVLAETYQPPPDGWTAAGDNELNTALPWQVGSGSGYDLFSVELHEMGHALGLGHSPDPANVMYESYQGVRTGLGPGDIAGIQALYGPRSLDSYQSHGVGTSTTSPINLTPGLSSSGQETVSGLGLRSIGDTEWFEVDVPAGATGLTVTAAASGISLMSPEVRILNAAQTTLAEQGNAQAWGDNATASITTGSPGTRYFIEVTGATHDVFAVGAYQLQVQFQGVHSAVTQSSAPTATPSQAPVTITPTPSAPTPSAAPTTGTLSLGPVSAASLPTPTLPPPVTQPLLPATFGTFFLGRGNYRGGGIGFGARGHGGLGLGNFGLGTFSHGSMPSFFSIGRFAGRSRFLR